MKTLTLFLIMSMGIISANNTSYSQTTVLSLKVKNKAFKEVFSEIESMSEYIFFYNDEVIDANRRVSVDVEDATINEILDKILNEKETSYKITDRQVTFFKNESVSNRVQASQQQQKKHAIKGLIKNASGETLVGVNIVELGTPAGVTIGTASNIDGEYTLDVSKPNTVLKISYIGFKTQEISVNGKNTIDIILEEEAQTFGDVVVVAYGSQKKESIVGSVQSLNVNDLKVPSSNLSTGFAGRLAGVVAMQRSGEPGADGADFWIRGISTFSGMTSPLIVIDGVKGSSGDLNALDPEVIESFSVLKDATATALYGSRGANGVMIVTTKSGRSLDKPVVQARFEVSHNAPIKVPKFVNGVRYMEMFNEAVTSRRTGETLYSDDKIYGTRNNLNSFVFPNVDWYDELFKNGSLSENLNVNIRGGGAKADYFSSISVNHDSGMLRNTKDFSYDNNIGINRYVLQNNVNVYITPTTKASIRLNTQLRDYKGPHSSAQDLFGLVMEGNPVDFPIRYPNDPEYDFIKWGGKSGGRHNNGFRNPYSEMVRGYKEIGIGV